MSEEQDISNQDAEIKSLKEKLAAATAVAFLNLQSGLWRHRTQGNATTIMDYVSLMRRYLAEQHSIEDLAEFLDEIDRVASSILAIPIVQPSVDDQENVNVNELLSERSEQLRSDNKYKTIEFRLLLDLTLGTSVRASRYLLAHCLDILIENAAKAMQSSAEKILTIGTRLARNAIVEISVGDTGCGVPDSIRTNLLKTPIVREEAKGLGMGLLVASMIIQSLAGDIRLAESGAKGTTFVISLPWVEVQREGGG